MSLGIDLEKLAQEFTFLSDTMKEIMNDIGTPEKMMEGAFKLGWMHCVCKNHSIAVSNLIPRPIVDVDQTPPAAPIS